MKKVSGFTLIELLIVMIIFSVLAAMITGNFFTSLKKGRDARRKNDLEQVQKSLEMYYEDKKAYPTVIPGGGSGFVFGSQFSDSVSGKVYMYRVPNDPTSGKNYQYVSSGQTYDLYTCLENTEQELPYVSTNYGSFTCSVNCKKSDGSSTTCIWGISDTNSNP
ncbi:type II secretion system protein [Candidatus Roizmanbacteria bacterium]|nr:type II secretion system protein [Candidatus Roizmanbacteria bacterium]